MPSFDIVSEVEQHEVTNAVDQSQREIGNRFDLRGTAAAVSEEKDGLLLCADNEFQLEQVMDVLRNKMAKRGVDAAALDPGVVESNVSEARRLVRLIQGIDTPTAKQIVGLIKRSKIKVQAAIQGEKVRVTGKKRDDLQQVMALLREETLAVPLQFNNLRD